MEDLKALLIRAKIGDHDAFTAIVRRFQDMAVGYAYSILGDFHLAQDAAQEAFFSAFNLLHQLRDPMRFSGWFRRIIVKQCDRIARKNRPQPVPDEMLMELPADVADPAEMLAERETKELVRQAMNALPPNHRRVTTLFYINEYSYKQIADFLEIPVTTVDNRLRASRKQLKERMIRIMQENLQQHRPSRDVEFMDKVLSTIRAMFEAIEAKDLLKLAPHYAHDEDLTAFLPTLPFRIDGYSHFWQAMEDYQSKKTASRVDVFQPKVQIYSDVAIATYYSTTRVSVPETSAPASDAASPRAHSARTTQVFHLRAGQWVLVHTHISPLP